MNLADILRIKRPHRGAGEAYLRALLRTRYGGKVDQAGNLTVKVGRKPAVCHCAHLDTVHERDGMHALAITDGVIRAPGSDCLGADDGAGIWLLCRLIEAAVPGQYVFFVGEEAGGAGSRAYSMPSHVRAVVAWDRRGTSDIVWAQGGHRCASAEAVIWLADRLPGYAGSDEGTFTDSRVFADTVPECLNMSVGYAHEHSEQESLDVRLLQWLATQIVMIPWADMPIVRTPGQDTRYRFPATSPFDWTRHDLDMPYRDWERFNAICRGEP